MLLLFWEFRFEAVSMDLILIFHSIKLIHRTYLWQSNFFVKFKYWLFWSPLVLPISKLNSNVDTIAKVGDCYCLLPNTHVLSNWSNPKTCYYWSESFKTKCIGLQKSGCLLVSVIWFPTMFFLCGITNNSPCVGVSLYICTNATC